MEYDGKSFPFKLTRLQFSFKITLHGINQEIHKPPLLEDALYRSQPEEGEEVEDAAIVLSMTSSIPKWTTQVLSMPLSKELPMKSVVSSIEWTWMVGGTDESSAFRFTMV